jgi:germination protein M
MKRMPIVALALILAGAVFAGCTPVTPTPPGGPGPSVITSPTATPTVTVEPTATPAPVTVRVYFALNEKMEPVLRELPAGTQTTLKGALVALIDGPDANESADGLVTMVPVGTVLRSVKISGKTATIDLTSEFESGGGTLTMTTRLAQMVYTATQFPTVKNVKFKIDGKAVSVFGGEGIMIGTPQTRADYEYSTPAIFVENPAWKATIKNGSVARGTADVFEAVFHLQLRDVAGKVLVNKTVHASSGTGTRGTWSLKLTWGAATPGVGELRVFATSAKNGAEIDKVTIPVTISE